MTPPAARRAQRRRRRGTNADMRLYSYVIEHDLGFAPNPFYQRCTLAACKPPIRKSAEIGDYVIGTGAAKPGLAGYLSYWMRVDEILAFDQYWSDPRYLRKRPFMRGARMQRYGDNIYHRDPETGEFIQEDSFHSRPDGVCNDENLNTDTGLTDRVLISADYAYWGGTGPKIPTVLADFVKSGPGYKCRFAADRVDAFLTWLGSMPERGYIGEPAHWRYLNDEN